MRTADAGNADTTTWPIGPRSAAPSRASSPSTTASTAESPTNVVSHGCGFDHQLRGPQRLHQCVEAGEVVDERDRARLRPGTVVGQPGEQLGVVGRAAREARDGVDLHVQPPAGPGRTAPCTASNRPSAASRRWSRSIVARSG